jgi:hypothetical protein
LEKRECPNEKQQSGVRDVLGCRSFGPAVSTDVFGVP